MHRPTRKSAQGVNYIQTLKKMKKAILVLAMVFGLGTVFGQQGAKWKDGELLAQLVQGTDVETLVEQLSTIELAKPKLLSKHVNIWQFQYNPSAVSIDEAIELLYQNQNVITAQRNHILKNRLTPNDAQYSQQWQYFQANDLDIDADQAWDVTTGGTMTTGDQIVVCVIDDGIQLTHPDLSPNLWTNTNEIAGNGVDDDGNGYIDDVKGWNADLNNDNVAHSNGEGHGSPVAGIIGAKGNNGIGVTGVNWDVKLMIVKGGGEEAEAIAAYSYALENRKLYNSSNGQNGAFVVATNASWGVDNGMASQAPLWCAMYDTLGNHGILNAGAGPNANTNVDTQGDLPTQCPSNFLVSVTNTDQTDTKIVPAGYGVNSIDLGAPGEGTHTIDDQDGGTYDSFGGTSGATPHVAGTIALLYSVPCANFANLAKSDPKMAAEKVRDFILNGVDANTSLNGITVTGGRLNVNNSVQALVNDCVSLDASEGDMGTYPMTLHPNPVTGNSLNLSLKSNVNERIVVEVTDLSGKAITSNTALVKAGNNLISVDLPNIAKGMYHLRVSSPNWSKTIKFVK